MKILCAPWVVPVEGPPIEGGALLISGGRIRDVGRLADLARTWPGVAREEAVGCALVPGLINAHAHLELTGLGERPAGLAFVEWILEVIRRKREAPDAAFAAGAVEGARRCYQGGQALVADVVSRATAGAAYPAGAPGVAAFPEVIAPGDDARRAVDEALALPLSQGVSRAGLSPHAPYTVSADGYRKVATVLAGREGLCMTHLAESEDEVVFCRTGRGPVLERLYGSLGVAPPRAPGCHPVEWLDSLGLLGPRTIAVHAVHLALGHVDTLARRGARVVLCPCSNRYMGVGAAPGLALRNAGVPLGLGTDSALSSGGLDLWGEIIAAVEDYGWSPSESFEAATQGGARVLGVASERGAFAPGRRADILAVPLAPGRELWDRLLAAPCRPRWME